jgi:hypothetical protein
MSKKPILKKLALVVAIFVLMGGGYGLYLWNMPHRDVQAAKVDFSLTAAEFVDDYLRDGAAANAKYLDAEGDSKILSLTGLVKAMRTNQAGESVLVLRAPGAEVGVACTFTVATNPVPGAVKIGDTVTVKGVVRAGAEYSDILGGYIDAVVEKCSLR